jgi:hypothetical protein
MTASGPPAPTACRNGAAAPDADPAGDAASQCFGNESPQVSAVVQRAKAGVVFSLSVRSQPSPRRDGRTRSRGGSAFSRRDHPRGCEPQNHRYASALAAKRWTVRATTDGIMRQAGAAPPDALFLPVFPDRVGGSVDDVRFVHRV